MKSFVMLPTYNERENISIVIDEISRCSPDSEIVVVDDDSPDKTWELVEEISRENPRVHLLRRTEDRGRGRAGVAGFVYALEHGADAIIEMDADLSHDPAYIPGFLSTIRDYDVVSGSRFIQGGQDAKRDWYRRLITFLANKYIRLFLRFKLTDCSSGYRCYRREVLENIGLDNLIATGPAIVQEILFRACQRGYRILEIPIIFRNRRLGRTKLTYRHLIKGFLMVLKLRFSNSAGANLLPVLLPEKSIQR